MTNNELELINLIRENENPEQALKIAVNVIATFLGRYVSYQEPFVDSRRELA